MSQMRVNRENWHLVLLSVNPVLFSVVWTVLYSIGAVATFSITNNLYIDIFYHAFLMATLVGYFLLPYAVWKICDESGFLEEKYYPKYLKVYLFTGFYYSIHIKGV